MYEDIKIGQAIKNISVKDRSKNINMHPWQECHIEINKVLLCRKGEQAQVQQVNP